VARYDYQVLWAAAQDACELTKGDMTLWRHYLSATPSSAAPTASD
jgi:hypothetical protein